MSLNARLAMAPVIVCFLLTLGAPLVQLGAAHATDAVIRLDPFPGEDELPFLPRYCWARVQILGGKDMNDLAPSVRDEVLKWREAVGEGIFTHLHHYCGGLARMYRYWASVELKGRQLDDAGRIMGGQKVTLEAAIGEFKYVQGYMKNLKSPIYLEMMIQKATAHWQLGEIEKAVSDLLTLLQDHLDYEQAYMVLSMMAEERGDRNDAIQILELGVQQTRGSSVLKARLDKLRPQ